MVWVGQNPRVFVIFSSSCLPYIKDCQLYSYRKYNYTDKYLLRFHSVPELWQEIGVSVFDWLALFCSLYL